LTLIQFPPKLAAMPKAKHPQAAAYVHSRLFADLTNFAELEARITALPEEKARGDAFEVFAEAYLATQRKHDAAQVWPHGSVPLATLKHLGLTESDQGVDGVLQTLLGEFDAYQVKFRTSRPALTWRELSTFIGLADSPRIHSRVLLTNCDELPAVLNEKQGFFCIRGADLDRMEADDFRAIEAWLADSTFVAPKKNPLPHQAEALEKILPAFKEHDRVSAIMACGTGKTLVALWVAESIAQAIGSREATPRKLASYEVAGDAPANFLRPEGTPDFHRPVRTDSVLDGEPDTACLANIQCPVGTTDGGVPTAKILVLLPSLALLRQTLHEWLRETRLPNLAYLCVCSDASVKEGLDALKTEQSDLDFQVSTEAASVRRFLDAPFAGVKMIFSTYQSAAVVGDALQASAPNCPPREWFDFAVFDEAHKTAGREGRNFGYALEDKNLPIRKRLFLTATPRHYNPRDRDREGEAKLVFSMDNPAVYGPQAYRLTFAEAARRGIICGYKVIISVITSEMVTNELLSHGEVLVNGDPVRARQVANQIALRDAIEKYGVSKVFTFHSTVKSAASFVADGSEGIRTHLPDYKTFHINGSMPTARRERELREFRASARAVVSNARCLTEGVDVPAVDMVAFLSPRRSRVDIVQATGRAMRRSPGKTTGYVLVPLYVELTAAETVEAAVNRAQFDDVWDVLQTMKEQDDILAGYISRIAIEKGRTGKQNGTACEQIEILGKAISVDTLKGAIQARCFEELYHSWDVSFGMLQKFVEVHGHCHPTIDDESQLNQWLRSQRSQYSKKQISSHRIAKLEELGIEWDLHEANWAENFESLKKYIELHGNQNVPYDSLQNISLAQWIRTQRQQFKKGQISSIRLAKLEAIGFAWHAVKLERRLGQNLSEWDAHYAQLQLFKNNIGHCCVPYTYSYGTPKRLGRWVSDQRILYKKGLLTAEQIKKLEAVGFKWKLRNKPRRSFRMPI
jgi:superfamily II DNA or RNA helicase